MTSARRSTARSGGGIASRPSPTASPGTSCPCRECRRGGGPERICGAHQAEPACLGRARRARERGQADAREKGPRRPLGRPAATGVRAGVATTSISTWSERVRRGRFFEHYAKERRLEGFCSFLGHRPRAWVHEHLQDYDLFVHPARYEGFGLVVAEAMAAGVPVLVFRRRRPDANRAESLVGDFFRSGGRRRPGCGFAILPGFVVCRTRAENGRRAGVRLLPFRRRRNG